MIELSSHVLEFPKNIVERNTLDLFITRVIAQNKEGILLYSVVIVYAAMIEQVESCQQDVVCLCAATKRSGCKKSKDYVNTQSQER